MNAIVVTGRPTDEELAAVLTVLFARLGPGRSQGTPDSRPRGMVSCRWQKTGTPAQGCDATGWGPEPRIWQLRPNPWTWT